MEAALLKPSMGLNDDCEDVLSVPTIFATLFHNITSMFLLPSKRSILRNLSTATIQIRVQVFKRILANFNHEGLAVNAEYEC